jgi:hypothetical protein
MTAHFFELLRAIRRWGTHYARISTIWKGLGSPSYSPDPQKAKGKTEILLDRLYLFFILKMLPVNYHLFQFDSKKRSEFREYMDEPLAPFLRHKLYRHLWDDRYSSLVNDKYVFHCFCRYHGIPVPELYGTLCREKWEETGKTLKKIFAAGPVEKVILKPLRGTQGEGIRFVSRKEIEDEGRFSDKDLRKGDYIIQEVVTQHRDLTRINPHSLNTIRLITLLSRDGETVPLAAMLRTSSTTSPIDNFATGGLVIGIDLETGKLRKYGFQKKEYGTIAENHPLTGVSFEGFEIPHWRDVMDITTKAQKEFHFLKSIGWDLAVTETGPVAIEGNLDWGTAGIQAANGGLLSPKNRETFAGHGLIL